MNGVARYFVLDAGIPVCLPLAVAFLYTHVKGRPFEPHRLLGDGQLWFYGITLCLITISQVVSVQGHDSVKPWASIVLGTCVILATAVWIIGLSETLQPDAGDAAGREASRKRITKASAILALAIIVLGGIFRWSAGLF